MSQLLTPKLDYVFKRLFTEDQEILLDLVNAVLNFPEPTRIQSIEVKNPEILPEQINEKYIILDILAIDRNGHQYDIEMQSQKYPYYLCRMYTMQLESGEEYEQLKPVIGIHFLDYEQFPKAADFRFCFEFRDAQDSDIRLTSKLAAYMFELPKFERTKQTERWGKKLAEWLHFFNHAPEEAEHAMQTQYTNPAVRKAFTVLERLSADEQTRYQAEWRERALKNKNSELSVAREEGRQEGELIGQIRLLQEFLHVPITVREELVEKDLAQLSEILQHLKTQLK